LLPTPLEALQMTVTFLLTLTAWVFFRTEDLTQATRMLSRMFIPDSYAWQGRFGDPMPWIVLLLIVEWTNRGREHGLEIAHWHPLLRWLIYALLTVLILIFFGKDNTFIYFQF